MNYDYSNNYYYYLGGNYRYNVDDQASIRYGYYKHAEVLNHVAWHYYQHVEDKDKLQMALTWSQSSLALDPENPYFLDTYAHLLYKTGKTKEAVKYQKKAVAQLNSKKLRFDIDYTQADTIRADYIKMKNKTL
jgi:predicted Zn-dependent protease